jgi:phage-related protein (TIGR01555 family)
LRTVEPVWVWPLNYDSINPLSPKWYRPETWFVMAQEVHKTRLLTFISREVPDLLKPAYMFGGQSLTQLMMPVVENWLSTRRAVGEIVKKFSFKVIYLNLVEALNTGNAAKLAKRISLFTQLQNNSGAMVLDKGSEEFVNSAVPLSGLEQLQAQAQEHQCSLSRIPAVKLLGIQPAGLNATSEGELRSFEENIHSYQEAFYRPNLTTVLNLVQCSLFGQVDPDITFEFESLTEEMSDGERATAANQVIGAASNAFESGLLGRADSLKTLRSLGDGLGITIEDSMVEEAENEPPQPSPEELKAEAEVIRAENT